MKPSTILHVNASSQHIIDRNTSGILEFCKCGYSKNEKYSEIWPLMRKYCIYVYISLMFVNLSPKRMMYSVRWGLNFFGANSY